MVGETIGQSLASSFIAGNLLSGFMPVLMLIAIWELIWKGIALWKTARNKQKIWFIFILVLNTVGILPIVYLLWFQKKAKK